MTEAKKLSLVKPTINTPFHIDFDWLKNHDNNWRVYLFSCLCDEHQAAFRNHEDDIWIDWISPETGEVKRVDGIRQTLMEHCAGLPDFYSSHTALVDSVFRLLLAYENQPMTPVEMEAKINRPAETILRTLAGSQVYKGLRPSQS